MSAATDILGHMRPGREYTVDVLANVSAGKRGNTHQALAGLVRRGEIERVRRGVYRLTAPPEPEGPSEAEVELARARDIMSGNLDDLTAPEQAAYLRGLATQA